jgi:hypothetical protein
MPFYTSHKSIFIPTDSYQYSPLDIDSVFIPRNLCYMNPSFKWRSALVLHAEHFIEEGSCVCVRDYTFIFLRTRIIILHARCRSSHLSNGLHIMIQVSLVFSLRLLGVLSMIHVDKLTKSKEKKLVIEELNNMVLDADETKSIPSTYQKMKLNGSS